MLILLLFFVIGICILVLVYSITYRICNCDDERQILNIQTTKNTIIENHSNIIEI